jgi:hypothetical protein
MRSGKQEDCTCMRITDGFVVELHENQRILVSCSAQTAYEEASGVIA